jgi:hypothetical protein
VPRFVHDDDHAEGEGEGEEGLEGVGQSIHADRVQFVEPWN